MNLDFKVEKAARYFELIVEAENVRAHSGLLDEIEAVEVAGELIYAAECLLPAKHSEDEQRLCIIRERLEKDV